MGVGFVDAYNESELLSYRIEQLERIDYGEDFENHNDYLFYLYSFIFKYGCTFLCIKLMYDVTLVSINIINVHMLL